MSQTQTINTNAHNLAFYAADAVQPDPFFPRVARTSDGHPALIGWDQCYEADAAAWAALKPHAFYLAGQWVPFTPETILDAFGSL